MSKYLPEITSKVKVSHYDYDLNKTVEDGDIDIYLPAKCATTGNVASFLETYMNIMSRDPYTTGHEVGLQFSRIHRTLQRSIVGFCIGILCAMGEQEYTDARNETAIQTCRTIKKMHDEDTLLIGQFI